MDNKLTARNPELQEESITELLGRLATDSAALVREEVALAKQEFYEKTEALRTGAIMMAIGAVLGIVALVTLWAALIIWLTANYLPATYAAAITGGGLIIFATIIVLVGDRILRKATATPIKTVEALQGRTEND